MLTAYRRTTDQRTTAAAIDTGFAVATRPSRKDALPEHTHYIDNGCDLHPSCLTCPLVRCRYDEPGGARRLFSDERDRRIVRLQREEQLSIDLLAQRFGVSRRTVFRVLARERMKRDGKR
jgi:hypothetical protein